MGNDIPELKVIKFVTFDMMGQYGVRISKFWFSSYFSFINEYLHVATTSMNPTRLDGTKMYSETRYKGTAQLISERSIQVAHTSHTHHETLWIDMHMLGESLEATHRETVKQAFIELYKVITVQP